MPGLTRMLIIVKPSETTPVKNEQLIMSAILFKQKSQHLYTRDVILLTQGKRLLFHVVRCHAVFNNIKMSFASANQNGMSLQRLKVLPR